MQSNPTFSQRKPLALAEGCHKRTVKHVSASASVAGSKQAVASALHSWSTPAVSYSCAGHVRLVQGLFGAGGKGEGFPVGGAAQGGGWHLDVVIRYGPDSGLDLHLLYSRHRLVQAGWCLLRSKGTNMPLPRGIASLRWI